MLPELLGREKASAGRLREKQGLRDGEMLIEIKQVQKAVGPHAGEEQ